MPTEAGDFPVEIRVLDPAFHDRAGFDCGWKRLNNFLKLTAKKHQKPEFVRVYVLTEPGMKDILGYHAINTGALVAEEYGDLAPRVMPQHGGVPIVYLSMVAVASKAQGGGLGGILMIHAFQKAIGVADEVGCHGMILEVMDDGGEEEIAKRLSFYGRYGFVSLPSQRLKMLVTMETMREAVKAEAAAA